MNALARTNSYCKGQTRLLIRECTPHQRTRKCLTVINLWSWAPDGCFIPRQTDRLTFSRNIRLRLRRVSYVWDSECQLRSHESRTRSRHGKELWGFGCEVLTDVEDFINYSYNNFQNVIITFTYDYWVTNRSIHQSKPCLQVTNTRDNMFVSSDRNIFRQCCWILWAYSP
jgi:hypothetical protein